MGFLDLFKRSSKTIFKSDNDDAEDNLQEKTSNIFQGFSIINSTKESFNKAQEKFSHPDKYDRNLYDSGAAKYKAKKEAFKQDKVIDPYSEKELTLTKREAKTKYGDKWQEHLAEADHITSIKRVYDDNKDSTWLTDQNIKEVANSQDNIRVTSRKINNAKREKTNKDFISNKEYLKEKDIKLTSKGKKNAIKDQELSEKYISKTLTKDKISNVVDTAHSAGMAGAINTAQYVAFSDSVYCICDVLKNKKSPSEAIVEISKNTAKASMKAYVTTAGLTTLEQSLSKVESALIQNMIKSNAPAKAIVCIQITGKTLMRFARGEIDAVECITEISSNGVGVLGTTYGAGIGQALIPIPVVGAVFGGIIGGIISNDILGCLKSQINEVYSVYKKGKEEATYYNQLAQQERAYREELKSNLEVYFKDFEEFFDKKFINLNEDIAKGNYVSATNTTKEMIDKLGGDSTKLKDFEDFMRG